MMKWFYAYCLMVVIASLTSCVERPANARLVEGTPEIYPDYVGVTVPAGIAPLNFNVKEENSGVFVEVKGSVSGEVLTAGGRLAEFDIDGWHRLTEENRGGQLDVTVWVKAQDGWRQYGAFPIFVSELPLEAWGLTYRRIAPGYEVYGKMGIYQRDLSCFDEDIIFQNTQTPGACVNCHTARATDPERFTFHVRGANGATLVVIDGHREWLKARNDSIGGSMVYPYWHPSGRFCAYSTNQTYQGFHAVRGERIEVFDQSSDVFVYDPAKHELILDERLMSKGHLESYPVFSPDGEWLYFCKSDREPIPERYQEIRYVICRIGFDAERGAFGERIDTVFDARALGKSAVHPRLSYDGRWLMFTVADYGCFPIWHREADNWLMDLETGTARPMDEANSGEADSWHNWSVDSHWFVFTSRRDDGLHTRLYLASVDEDGRVSKPFMLPQKNPERFYGRLLQSYNTPDFTLRRVEFDSRRAGAEILSDQRTATYVRGEKD